MSVDRIAEGVLFVRSETADGREVWSYVTEWGTLRDVQALIGSMIHRQFKPLLKYVSAATLRGEAVGALHLAMAEYCGQRELLSYASYYVFRAIRKYAETCGELRIGDAVAYMRLRRRSFVLEFDGKEIAISRLAISEPVSEHNGESVDFTMDIFATPEARRDMSALWGYGQACALATGQQHAARNWEMLQSRCSGWEWATIAEWHGMSRGGCISAVRSLCARVAVVADQRKMEELYVSSDDVRFVAQNCALSIHDQRGTVCV
jgi:hypothetical protein